MPIVPLETVFFPEHLFLESARSEFSDREWWVLHVKPRQEKRLATQLFDKDVPFYLPLVERSCCIRGRSVSSWHPLFPGYLFLMANRDERVTALSTGRVVRSLAVPEQDNLWHDLGQLQRLLGSQKAAMAEERLVAGTLVEIVSGPLAGLRGKILRGASGQRFVVEIAFIQRGASVLLEGASLVPVAGKSTPSS